MHDGRAEAARSTSIAALIARTWAGTGLTADGGQGCGPPDKSCRRPVAGVEGLQGAELQLPLGAVGDRRTLVRRPEAVAFHGSSRAGTSRRRDAEQDTIVGHVKEIADAEEI